MGRTVRQKIVGGWPAPTHSQEVVDFECEKGCPNSRIKVIVGIVSGKPITGEQIYCPRCWGPARRAT